MSSQIATSHMSLERPISFITSAVTFSALIPSPTRMKAIRGTARNASNTSSRLAGRVRSTIQW
jgi:hypothetical protein